LSRKLLFLNKTLLTLKKVLGFRLVIIQHGGQHLLGGTPLRKNYAGLGYTYDSTRDAFIPVKPYPSWVLNEETCLWDCPVVYPSDASEDKRYAWNEDTTSWVEVT